MQAVLDHSAQPSSDKYLLLLIAYTENEKDGRCNPSVDVIAFYHNTETRNIRKRLNLLVDAGELVITSRRGRSNYYAIPLYPDEPGWYDPGPCQDTETHKCNGHHGPIINRTELAMQNNPRRQAQQSRTQAAQQAIRQEQRTVLQDRGGAVPQDRGNKAGLSPRTGGAVPQDRGGGTPGQGGTVLQDSQNMNGTGSEQEVNMGVAPSINVWLTWPENREIRRLARSSEQIIAYDDWCAEQGLEPVR